MVETTEQYREIFDAGEALSSVGGDAEYLTEVVGLMQAAWPTLLADIRKGMARRDLRAVEVTARLARAAAQNVAAKRAYASAHGWRQWRAREIFPPPKAPLPAWSAKWPCSNSASRRSEQPIVVRDPLIHSRPGAGWFAGCPANTQLRGRYTMGLDVQVQEADTHLEIEAEGRYSFAELSGLFDRVKAESENCARQNVVLDVTKIAGTIPLMDMFALGEHCAKVWKAPFRIAIVFPEGGVYNFFENVARNRGVQVAVVPNHGAAVKWLAKP